MFTSKSLTASVNFSQEDEGGHRLHENGKGSAASLRRKVVKCSPGEWKSLPTDLPLCNVPHVNNRNIRIDTDDNIISRI